MATSKDQKLIEALRFAEAALADIGDAEREPGDDLAWCERRAAQALPRIREALAECQAAPANTPAPRSEPLLDEMEETLHDLDQWCRAYPLNAFPDPDPADLKWLHETRPGLCDRISAKMGRHMVVHMRRMADAFRGYVASAKAAARTADASGAAQGRRG